METVFAADIGGTKSELAVFTRRTGVLVPLIQKRYENGQYNGIEEIIADFLAESAHQPRLACIAVAGLVTGEIAQLTNLPWQVDGRRLREQYNFQSVLLINDLTAVAAAIRHLGIDDLAEIKAGNPVGGEICGVVAPGTGLGEGLLLDIGGKLFVRGSEGGHTDFAPVDDEQSALLAWMRKRHNPVSCEMLMAGPGLGHLYDFCREYHGLAESVDIAEAMAVAHDRIPIIIEGAVRENACPLCRRVVALFLSMLGSETGNLALKLYARGGMYLGGGILPRLFGKLSFAGFSQSFGNKGLMADFMRDIPVYLILRRDAALFGAAQYGWALFSASHISDTHG